MKKTVLSMVLAISVILSFSQGAFSEEKGTEASAKVRVGASPSFASAGIFIAYEKGFFREEGLDVELTVHQQTTVEILPLLATNKLDVGGCALGAGIINAFNQDTGVRMVACMGRHEGARSHLIVVVNSKETGELTADRIRGQKFAIPSRGVIHEIIIEKFLSGYGLGIGDVEIVTMSYPNINMALASGAIFGSVQLEPFASMGIAEGYALPVVKAGDIRPKFQGGILLYSGGFISNKEAADKWMVAYLKGVRVFNDFLNGKIDDKEIFDIISKYTSIKNYDVFKRISFGGLNPDGFVDKESVKEDIDWYYDHGYVASRPDVNDIVDDEFAEYAVKELGPYRSDK
ncbi:MAG: ABC transporter substrate-binding protein [Candidatus Omnitrophica bacterium]|nr:ABC transporter substrate-binding protein [Candidatus Omnitrophota bacterium]MDD4013777.1 ABC transporter substrate-binding protein [Candidatus Omnitrophota bacterium]